MIRRHCLTFLMVPLFVVSGAAMMGVHVDAEPAQPASTGGFGPKQVLGNQELMKFLFEPLTTELKRGVQIEPESRQDWQSLYASTYRVGEALNLLYFREGKDYMQTDDWRRMTTESRDAAVSLGEAVKKRDFPGVQVRYEALIKSCNACHRKFEEGDPTVVQPW